MRGVLNWLFPVKTAAFEMGLEDRGEVAWHHEGGGRRSKPICSTCHTPIRVGLTKDQKPTRYCYVCKEHK